MNTRPSEFEALFEQFEHTAFRLETRDLYDVPEERAAFSAFLAGEQQPPRTPANDPWLKLVATTTESGRAIIRVRVVGRPLTDYSRFELAAYRDNLAAGEDVRVIERAALDPATHPWAETDFWLFDDTTVALMHYDRRGRFIEAEVLSPRRIAPYWDAKNQALALATAI